MRSVWVFLYALSSLVLAGAGVRAEGALVAFGADGQPRNFPLVRTEVDGDVAGRVVSVWVTQRFRNEFAERVEATYLFPLPEGAAVDAMEMRIGRRVVRADVARREEARRRYEAARDQGRRATLLEQERPNAFTFSVANIDPGGEIEVRLHYFEMARYDRGVYEVVFPMVVGPRYIPGAALPGPQTGTGPHPDTDRVRDGSRISTAYTPPGTRSGHAISLNLRVDAGAPVASVETPAHDTALRRPTPSRVEVSLRDKDEIPNRDFILRWTLDAPELRTALFAHRPDPAQDGYFALLLHPRSDPPTDEIAPRELFFLLDTSGSMHGAPLDAVKRAVRRALETLRPDDAFQIIDFADTASSFAPTPVAATVDNINRGVRHLHDLQSSGGTNQLAGIHAALAAPGDPSRLRYVMFMTDGFIGNESEVIALTQREIGDARIFGFGVGSSVNRYLLDEVSRAGRGAAEYLRTQESPDALVQRFYERIGSPYLVDVSIDWGGLQARDVYPDPLPDVSSFQPLVVFGRYRSSGAATITLRGRIGQRPFERRITLDLPATAAEHAAIARLWARAKIASLTRATRRDGERPELVEAITAVALENHLVSQYTSLVAIDETPPELGVGGPPIRVVQPAEAPAGVDLPMAGAYAVGQDVGYFDDGTRLLLLIDPGVEDGDDELYGGHLPWPDGATMRVRAPPSGGTTRGWSNTRGGCASCTVTSARASARDGLLVLLVVALVSARTRARRVNGG